MIDHVTGLLVLFYQEQNAVTAFPFLPNYLRRYIVPNILSMLIAC